MADLSLNIVYKYQNKYYGNFPQTGDVLHNTRLFFNASWPSSSIYGASTEYCYSTLELEEFFVVPRLNKFPESQNRIKKHRLVEGFISFLLQLLHPESDELDWVIYREFKDQIKNLGKELGILLTILGDTLLLLCDDENEEFQKLLAEFEALANGAASLVLSYPLIFPLDPAYIKLVEDFDVVLNRIDLLQTSIMKFLNLVPCISTSSAYVTPKISVVDSLLADDSLIYDLNNLMNREGNSTADVKDQIERLHQGLTLVKSSIKHIGWQQPSEIGELKETLSRIGDMARGAEYLTVSFLAGDAPLCYLITRFTNINDKIDHIATELIEITKKYTCGGLKVAEHFSAQQPLEAKENTEVDDVTVGFDDNGTYILDQLVGGTERLQVVSVFGMPGLGKTTLAKKLYIHSTVNYHFDKLSWCVVSRTYMRQSILANILIHLTSELGKDRILEMEEESLVEHIYKTLKGRRHLVVMDDIRTSNLWDDLRRCSPDDENRSRILFATRNRNAVPHNSIIYAVPSLSNDQCWEILEKKVFKNIPCPPELLRIGRKIAANCGGVPLAVVVIAGILSTIDRERNTWEEVQENLA